MATEVLMPQMGESIAEGTISRWLVKQGDAVERDQPLFEISTDKVDAEIPSPAAGVLIEIKHGEGDTVPVNEVVALIGEAGEKPSAPEPQAKKEEEEAEAPAGESEESAAGTEAAGSEPSTAKARQQVAAEAESEPESPSEPVSEAEEELAERVRQASSPVVRNIAAKEGVDLSEVEGTGIHGRVTKSDVMTYLQKRETTPAVQAPKSAPAIPAQRDTGGFSVPAYTEGENVEIEPMSRIRQITAAHMIYSKTTSAHVSTVFHMDFSKVHVARERAKAGFLKAHGTKLTYMPFIFKAVAAGLRRNPKLNSSIDGTNIVYKKDINLGMAVALDWVSSFR